MRRRKRKPRDLVERFQSTCGWCGKHIPDDTEVYSGGGKARPGIALALQHTTKPDRVATVFAGADVEATERAREYFTGYAPSSPSIAILRDGKLVYMLERRHIENRDAPAIAAELAHAFDKFCAPTLTA